MKIPRMGANILNHVKIKGNHSRLHLIMEITIESHCLFIYMPYHMPGICA